MGLAGFDAVVLAGGRGRRLGGVDKPDLRVGGTTLAEWAVRAAAGAGAGRIVVVGPERPGLATAASHAATLTLPGGATSPEVVVAREEQPGSGPIAGLRAGITEVRAPAVVLLAADLPFLRTWHVSTLAALCLAGLPASGGTWELAGAVMLDDSDRAQWLLSAWPTAALGQALALYQGQSLRGLLEPLPWRQVPYRPRAGEPPPWLDVDTPETLAWAREWHERDTT